MEGVCVFDEYEEDDDESIFDEYEEDDDESMDSLIEV